MQQRGIGKGALALALLAATWVTASAPPVGAAGAGDHPPGVPGEVLLSGAADVKALCAELRTGDGEAKSAVYTMVLSSASWSFAPYDGKRARLRIDASKGFRAPTGAWELAPVTPADGSGLDIAIPASGKEAAQLIRESRAAELQLWLWFTPQALPKQAGPCAEVHGVKGQTLRLGATTMAFALWRGKEQVASGETSAFAALRAAGGPVGEPGVELGKAVRTGERGNAPEGVAKAVAQLQPRFLECYRGGLEHDPELRGALVVGVAVDASGKVSDARAEIDGLGAPAVSACVLARLKAARFPAGEALRFSVPVRFGAAP